MVSTIFYFPWTLILAIFVGFLVYRKNKDLEKSAGAAVVLYFGLGLAGVIVLALFLGLFDFGFDLETSLLETFSPVLLIFFLIYGALVYIGWRMYKKKGLFD